MSIGQKIVPGQHLLFWRKRETVVLTVQTTSFSISMVRDNLRFWDNDVGISEMFLLP